jgi:hypothetical protein
MKLTQHFHPEFGYFHPVPRLRRELRLALAAFASGAALGAIAIVAVGASHREDAIASGPVGVDTATAIAERPVSRPATPTQRRPDNEPLIARVPVGRSGSLSEASPLSAPAEAFDSSGGRAEASDVQAGARTYSGPSTGETARKRRKFVRAQQEKNPRPGLGHQERSPGSANALAPPEERMASSRGSAYAGGRTVFWDWSR